MINTYVKGTFNLFPLLFDLFYKLVELMKVLENFLFTEIVIGAWTISLWQVVGGGSIVLLITAYIVKEVVPLA